MIESSNQCSSEWGPALAALSQRLSKALASAEPVSESAASALLARKGQGEGQGQGQGEGEGGEGDRRGSTWDGPPSSSADISAGVPSSGQERLLDDANAARNALVDIARDMDQAVHRHFLFSLALSSLDDEENMG
jgi:hypothetical protein